MNSTCLILVPVVTTGCTTVNNTVYTLQPVVPTGLANRLQSVNAVSHTHTNMYNRAGEHPTNAFDYVGMSNKCYTYQQCCTWENVITYLQIFPVYVVNIWSEVTSKGLYSYQLHRQSKYIFLTFVYTVISLKPSFNLSLCNLGLFQ